MLFKTVSPFGLCYLNDIGDLILVFAFALPTDVVEDCLGPTILKDVEVRTLGIAVDAFVLGVVERMPVTPSYLLFTGVDPKPNLTSLSTLSFINMGIALFQRLKMRARSLLDAAVEVVDSSASDLHELFNNSSVEISDIILEAIHLSSINFFASSKTLPGCARFWATNGVTLYFSFKRLVCSTIS